MSGYHIFIGCDPGASGAIAVVDEHGRPKGWIAGDATDRDLLDFLSDVTMEEPDGNMAAVAALEEVGPKPRIAESGQRVSMGAKSAFVFGESYGRERMALVASHIRFDKVLPATWQAAMRCRTRGDKRISKARAQELLPGERITHRNADAYLLALYALSLYRKEAP